MQIALCRQSWNIKIKSTWWAVLDPSSHGKHFSWIVAVVYIYLAYVMHIILYVFWQCDSCGLHVNNNVSYIASEQVSLNYERQPGKTVWAYAPTYCVTRDSSCVQHSWEAAGARVSTACIYKGFKQLHRLVHGCSQDVLHCPSWAE